MKKLSHFTLWIFLVLQSISLYSQTYKSFLRRGNDQFELKAYSEAINNYQEVLSRKSDEPEALEKIALAHANLNQMEQAADYMAKLVRQRNSAPDVSFAYGQILRSLGRYEEAKTYFAQDVRTDPARAGQLVRACEFAISQQYLRGDYTVVEERVNSPASDFGPTFYRNQLVYASSRTDIQRPNAGWDGIAHSLLFVSAIGTDTYLQPAAMFGSNRQSQGVGPVTFSSNGQMIAFTKNSFVSGVRPIPSNFPELSIFFSEISSEGNWVNEQSFIHNNGKTGYPFLTSDGNSLYFAAERPGGYGGMDIYVSVRDGNSWSKPINVGSEINTPGDEISPFLVGESLYFASDYHEGFGGLDIFVADMSMGKWAKITNLGIPVNSSRDDFGFIWDPLRNLGFFTSNRGGGRGAEDIYHVQKGGGSAAQRPVLIRVLDAVSRNPIQGATLDLTACAGVQKLVYSDHQGQYNVASVQSAGCQVVVSYSGYETGSVQVGTGSPEVEVLLSPLGSAYYGTVIDLSSGLGVAGVDIQARNLNGSQVLRATSDRYGEYSLTLSPNASYQLTYSMRGYQEYRKSVTTTYGSDRTVLGTLPLTRITEANQSLPPDSKPSWSGSAGYSIQIAAMARNPDLGVYSNLRTVGNVYAAFEKGMYKVRVGPFESQGAASALVPRVKGLGYSGAFVVQDVAQPASVPSVPPVTPNVPGKIETQSTDGQIMIQLGAYSNPAYFDGSRVALIGPVVDRKKGTLTIKLITGFFTIEEARQKLPAVRAAGFSGAFIVQERNGERIPIK